VSEFLEAEVIVTDWTIDATCADNGADILVGSNHIVGMAQLECHLRTIFIFATDKR
jgi:hypothetical protein